MEYYSLTDYIVHPSLSGFTAAIFLYGAWFIARLLITQLLKRDISVLENSAGYFIVLTFVASSLYVVSFFNGVSVYSARIISVCYMTSILSQFLGTFKMSHPLRYN